MAIGKLTDKNAYLVGHMFHLVGHASDFVELEERFQARTDLSWTALENSLNQARETEENKNLCRLGPPNQCSCWRWPPGSLFG